MRFRVAAFAVTICVVSSLGTVAQQRELPRLEPLSQRNVDRLEVVASLDNNAIQAMGLPVYDARTPQGLFFVDWPANTIRIYREGASGLELWSIDPPTQYGFLELDWPSQRFVHTYKSFGDYVAIGGSDVSDFGKTYWKFIDTTSDDVVFKLDVNEDDNLIFNPTRPWIAISEAQFGASRDTDTTDPQLDTGAETIVIDIETQRVVARLAYPLVGHIEFSPDGERLLVGGHDHRVVEMELTGEMERTTIRRPNLDGEFARDGVAVIAYAANETVAVLAWDSYYCLVGIWDSERKEVIAFQDFVGLYVAEIATGIAGIITTDSEILVDLHTAKPLAEFSADYSVIHAHRDAGLLVVNNRAVTPPVVQFLDLHGRYIADLPVQPPQDYMNFDYDVQFNDSGTAVELHLYQRLIGEQGNYAEQTIGSWLLGVPAE